MKTTLKPCPFCGAEADVGRGIVTNYRIQSDGLLLATIHCSGCDAEMEVAADSPSENGEFIFAHKDGDAWEFFDHEIEAVTKAAVAAWNRREPLA